MEEWYLIKIEMKTILWDTINMDEMFPRRKLIFESIDTNPNMIVYNPMPRIDLPRGLQPSTFWRSVLFSSVNCETAFVPDSRKLFSLHSRIEEEVGFMVLHYYPEYSIEQILAIQDSNNLIYSQDIRLPVCYLFVVVAIFKLKACFLTETIFHVWTCFGCVPKFASMQFWH